MVGYAPPQMLRGVFAGAGPAMMGEPAVVSAVLELTGKPAENVNLVYLGTATYDLPEPRTKQTAGFAERGVAVRALELAKTAPAAGVVAAVLGAADVVLVSGGNTQFAVDRWRRTQLVEPLRAAMERGAVLCGGSAGAGCWFDGLHSDSMDPETYRAHMLAAEAGAVEEAKQGVASSDASPPPWEYIRVSCLGFLPGLLCPHYDRVQSNGVLRSTDFDGMLRSHAGEAGIAIDHFAALVVNGGGYSVLALPDKPGSRMPDGSHVPEQGVPGAWLQNTLPAAGGGVTIETVALPETGKLADILRPAKEIAEDPRVPTARAENPSDDLA